MSRAVFYGKVLLLLPLNRRKKKPEATSKGNINYIQSIDAWQDPWLKRNNGFKAHPVDHNTPTPLKVASLIDSINRSWNYEMIKETFTKADAEYITSIHLSRSSVLDKLI